MGTTILRPNGFKAGSADISDGVNVTRFGGAHDWTVLGDNSDASYILSNGNPAINAHSTILSLAVSGADVPGGHTVIKYRVGIRGFASTKRSTKIASAIVNDSWSGGIGVSNDGSHVIKTSYSPWSNYISGVQATKASIIAAGLKFAWTGNADSWEANDAWVELLYNETPDVPESFYPYDGAAIDVDNPAIGAKLSAIASGQKQKAEFEFATNATFTANLKDYVEPDANLRLSGSQFTTLPDADKLVPGTWYCRCRSVDEFGLVGAWSATVSFTVDHPSSAQQLVPSGSGNPWNAGSINFGWKFSDTAAPLDHQTAYQIQLATQDHLTSILDTGKQVSTVDNVNLNVPSGYESTEMSWRIQVWDENDETAGYGNWLDFIADEIPTVTIDSVDTASPAPTVDWHFTSPSGTTQRSYNVSYYDNTSGALIFTTGWVVDTVNTIYSPPSNIITNGENVKVTVAVQDSSGFTVISAPDVYVAAWVVSATPAFTIDSTRYGVEGYDYIKLTWNNSVQDAHWYSYQVWRKLSTDTFWEVVYETTAIQVAYEYDDYLCPANVSVDYAVVQTTKQSIDDPTSVPSAPNPQTLTPQSMKYIIVDESDHTMNLQVSVTDDQYTDELEQEVLQIIGRGRKVDTGTDWGISGTLTLQNYGTPLLTPSQVRDRIMALAKASEDEIYLRNTFGQVIRVNLGQPQVTRKPGGGPSDFSSIQITYVEVS